jgi:hypothetical protein
MYLKPIRLKHLHFTQFITCEDYSEATFDEPPTKQAMRIKTFYYVEKVRTFVTSQRTPISNKSSICELSHI